MKCLALDLDGTTLNCLNRISKQNLQAIQKAHQQGYLIVPCTGRSLDMIPAQLNELDCIDFVICSNGAVIYNYKTKEKIYEACISNQESLSFLQSLPSFYISANIDGKMVLQKGWIGTLYSFLRKNNKTKYLKVNRIDSYLKSTQKDVECFQMYTLKPEIHFQLLKQLSKFPSMAQANTNAPKNRYTEIYSSSSSKGKALSFLCDFFSISKENIYSIGDGENDVSMFEISNLSMAMKKGHPDCILQADVLVDSVAQGIYEYILKES
ncbi:HAD-IIB family hydrolase [Floccifex sp.]|uniref:HAD-IIB family hydrolase n=1 Tax=Floccifex sp. TaxID=2815810 RepID=UPI003F05C942